MYCPSCGTPEQRPEAYCSRCGMWLPSADGVRRGQSPQEKMRAVLTFNVGNAVMALTAAILLYASHWGQSAHWSVYVAASVCTVIAGHQLVSLYYNWQMRQRLQAAREEAMQPRQLPAQQKVNALPPASDLPFVAPPSVVERTTELLPRKEKT